LARKPTKVAAIALANKIARMAWAMMAKVIRVLALNRPIAPSIDRPVDVQV
jgi:hypothetical protein